MAGPSGLYPDRYGAWAGDLRGTKPDHSRCCEKVWSLGIHGGQCQRKRGFGPDNAYCRQHDPAAKAARELASRRKWVDESNRDRFKWHGKQFFKVLQMIADGHNDARGLAQDTIEKFNAGAEKMP